MTLQKTAESIASGNINLRLNYATIDDIIRRAISLSEPHFRDITEKDYAETYRAIYGKNIFEGKVVVVRSDLNSPVEYKNGGYHIVGKSRIRESVPTIKELSGYGAKVVVIAHQGTAGKIDCISLEPHKKALEEFLKKEIIFRRAHWYGTATEEIITQNMKNGDIFLSDNLRKLSDETSDLRDPNQFSSLPDSYMTTLERLADFYVNDAFSTSHRWHGSIIGFQHLLNIAGRLTEKEIENNKKLIVNLKRPYTLLLGGVKILEYLEFIEDSLENKLVDNVLAAGVLGIIAVLGTKTNGHLIDLGKKTEEFIKEKGLYPLRRKVRGLAKNEERFIVPVDFKVDLHGEACYMTPEEISMHLRKDDIGIYGLGPKTVALFSRKLEDSKTIYIKGSQTKDDDERFLTEARELIDKTVTLKRESGVITILSGGDTNNLVSRFGYNPKADFTYFTLAGGASTEYLAGNLLPGTLMLNTSYNAFWSLPLENGLPEGYNLGFQLIAPKIQDNLKPFRR